MNYFSYFHFAVANPPYLLNSNSVINVPLKRRLVYFNILYSETKL